MPDNNRKALTDNSLQSFTDSGIIPQVDEMVGDMANILEDSERNEFMERLAGVSDTLQSQDFPPEELKKVLDYFIRQYNKGEIILLKE